MPDTVSLGPKDALSQVLGLLNLTADLLAIMKCGKEWGIHFKQGDRFFHLVAQGTVYLRVEEGTALYQGNPGDLFVLANGHAHELLGHPHGTARPLDELIRRSWNETTGVLQLGENELQATVLCGTFTVEHQGAGTFLEWLPSVLHLHEDKANRESSFWALIPLIHREISQRGPGSAIICNRLFETIVVYAIRSWVERADNGDRNWLRGLRDRGLARVLGALHTRPNEAWNVTRMARIAGMSRAAFAGRFVELVGNPPMRYLTQQRMILAAHWLGQGKSVGETSALVGYESEAAFSRTFKRVMKIPPSVARRGALDNPRG